MKCPYCFNEVGPYKFCEHCGGNLELARTEATKPSLIMSNNMKKTVSENRGWTPQPEVTPMQVTANSASNYAPVKAEEPVGVAVPTVAEGNSEDKKRRQLMIIIYAVILALCIVLGVLFGILTAKLTSSDGENSDFHWDYASGYDVVEEQTE